MPNRAALARAVETTVVAAARAPVILILAVGLCLASLNGSRRLFAAGVGGHPGWFIAICVVVIAIFLTAGWLAQRARPLAPLPFWLAALALGLLLRGWYVFAAEAIWVNDFLTYWEVGLDLTRSGSPAATTVYEQRAYFLTWPVIQLFGDSRNAMMMLNIAFLSVIQIVGYDLLRRTANHQAAQAFSLLWIATPEPTLTAAAPNHDLAGLVLLVCALWLATRATLAIPTHPRLGFRILAALCAGALLALLEAVRGLGWFYLGVSGVIVVALAIVLLLRSSQAALRSRLLRGASLHLFVATATCALLSTALSATGWSRTPENAAPTNISYTMPHATSLSDGTNAFMRRFEDRFTLDMLDEPDALAQLRHSLVLSDVIRDPLAKPRNVYRRLPRQYNLGSQLYFYLRGVAPPLRFAVERFTPSFVVGFSALLLYALWRQLRAPWRDPLASFLVLLVSGLSLTLLVTGENQPRYIFPIWFVGAFLIAARLADGRPGPVIGAEAVTENTWSKLLQVGRWFTVSCVFATLTAAAAYVGAVALLPDAKGRILDDWRFDGTSTEEAVFLERLQSAPPTGFALRIDDVGFESLSLKLMLAGTPESHPQIAAVRRVCGVVPGTTFEFHYDHRAKHLRGRNAYALRLFSGERELWHAALPNGERPQAVSIPLEPGNDGCVTLRFSLDANVSYDRVSWQNASFVEIFFPRLRAP